MCFFLYTVTHVLRSRIHTRALSHGNGSSLVWLSDAKASWGYAQWTTGLARFWKQLPKKSILLARQLDFGPSRPHSSDRQPLRGQAVLVVSAQTDLCLERS